MEALRSSDSHSLPSTPERCLSPGINFDNKQQLASPAPVAPKDLELENQELKRELFRLQSLLQARKNKEERNRNREVPEEIQSSSDEELVARSGLRLVPLFREDKCVEIMAQVVDDIPKMKKKKKKKNKKKKTGKHKKGLQKPVMTASTDADEIFHSAYESDNEQVMGKMKEYKIRALNTVRKHTPVALITEVTSVEELLKKELDTGIPFSAFYLVNLGAVVEKYIEWTSNLPRVQPFYAVKSNPDINIIRTLHSLGCGFDCASKAELTDALSVGASTKDIVYANPCKGHEHIQFAKESGVDMMTFDSLAELNKISTIAPSTKCVLRILPDDSKSIMPFGAKFGASLGDCKILISKCKELNLNLTGVSFHVGSGCFSSQAWVDATLLARQVFDMAEQEGYKLTLLDLGGGWPGVDTESLNFTDIAKDLAPILDQHFPPEVRIIAEPGRFFCTSCYTLAVNIISRRERFVKVPRKPEDETDGDNGNKEESENPPDELTKEVLYYLSDGLYGSFNNIVFDYAKPVPVPLKKEAIDTNSETSPATNLQKSSLFGPTCDSIDVICKDIELPELEIGDWLYFLNMGAYTLASASNFNGFKPPNAKYLMYTGDTLSIS